MASLLGAGACEAAGAAVATYAPRSFSVPTVKVQTHKAPVVKRRLRRNSLSVASQSGLRETPDPLELSSSVAYMIDQDTGEVYFEKNAYIKLPIASVTKLMTALLVMEHGNLNDTVTFSKAATTNLESGAVTLSLTEGDKAFVMINGCGATTLMEQLILFKDTVAYLRGRGVEVVASMVGEILTVQESGGFQMNIAKWDDEFVRLWNTPAHTPVFFRE